MDDTQEAIETLDATKDTPKPFDPTIDVSKALTLRLKHHMSYRDIADKLKCSKSGVHGALTKIMDIIDDPALTTAYKHNKSDLIESVQLKYLCAMADSGKIERASANNAAYAVSQLDNMIRLDRGQSTENISIDEVNQRLKERQREIEELKAMVEE